MAAAGAAAGPHAASRPDVRRGHQGRARGRRRHGHRGHRHRDRRRRTAGQGLRRIVALRHPGRRAAGEVRVAARPQPASEGALALRHPGVRRPRPSTCRCAACRATSAEPAERRRRPSRRRSAPSRSPRARRRSGIGRVALRPRWLRQRDRSRPLQPDQPPQPASDELRRGGRQARAASEDPARGSGAPVGSTGSLFDIAAPDPAPSARRPSIGGPRSRRVGRRGAVGRVDGDNVRRLRSDRVDRRVGRPRGAGRSQPRHGARLVGHRQRACDLDPRGRFALRHRGAHAACATPARGQPSPKRAEPEPTVRRRAGAEPPATDAESDVAETSRGRRRGRRGGDRGDPSSTRVRRRPVRVSTPATSIPEGGSLFDIEAPTPSAPAPPRPAAPAAPSRDRQPTERRGGLDADAGRDGRRPTKPTTLSAGAALSRAATFRRRRTKQSETAGAGDARASPPSPTTQSPTTRSRDPPTAKETADADRRDSPDGDDRRRPRPTAPQQAPRGDVHTPKTDVDINEAGSLFDL